MMSRVTRRMAVWLLSTESLGLESTRTSPNDSSSLSVAVKLPPLDTKERKNGAALKPGVAEVVGVIGGWPIERPRLRTRSQEMPRWYSLCSNEYQRGISWDLVMPRWYSLRSCTSATVASISTWRNEYQR